MTQWVLAFPCRGEPAPLLVRLGPADRRTGEPANRLRCAGANCPDANKLLGNDLLAAGSGSQSRCGCGDRGADASRRRGTGGDWGGRSLQEHRGEVNPLQVAALTALQEQAKIDALHLISQDLSALREAVESLESR